MNTAVVAATASANTSHLATKSGVSERCSTTGYAVCPMPQARVVRSPTSDATSAGTSAS